MRRGSPRRATNPYSPLLVVALLAFALGGGCSGELAGGGGDGGPIGRLDAIDDRGASDASARDDASDPEQGGAGDAEQDAPVDAWPDATADARRDMAVDARRDMAVDTRPDTAVDTRPDTAVDTRPDTVDAAPADASVVAPVVHTAIISTTHRFEPGAMHGGWGPHLGHLVRSADGRLLWVDDGCEQAGGTEVCDVDRNQRIEYYERVGQLWQARSVLGLPAGVQQNTGTVSGVDGLASYGIDIATKQLIECRMNPSTWIGSCAPMAVAPLPASTNYVGAALSPDGYTVVWATTVVNGGGGSFHWYVDYGGGWNGPRTGYVGGYNDASYINIAFGTGATSTDFVLHAQLVSGWTPNWGFHAAVADGDAASANAVAFTRLGDVAGDPLISTNDVVMDPLSGDTHVIARTAAGAVAYLHRAAGGPYAAPTIAIPSTYRARWVTLANDTLVLVYGRNGVGLLYRVFPATARSPGVPLDIPAAPEHAVALPAGYTNIIALYPESVSYQVALPTNVNVAVVGSDRQFEVLHVSIEGL